MRGKERISVECAIIPWAKHLIFLRTEKNRGVFHEFYARFFINVRFIL